MYKTAVFVTALCLAVAGPALAGSHSLPGWVSTHDFPNASSTVISTGGGLGANEVGWFWSGTLGHQVSGTLTDPMSELTGVALELEVPSTTLASGSVTWAVEINSLEVGQFDVGAGFTGPVDVDFSFPAILPMGDTYEIVLSVRNDVPFGEGAHTLAIGDPYAHAIHLIPEPATLTVLAVGGVMLARRRRR